MYLMPLSSWTTFRIPLRTTDASFNVAVAGSLVLYDRLAKERVRADTKSAAKWGKKKKKTHTAPEGEAE